MIKRAMLALEDGTVYEGRAFGAEGEKEGEVVFNTSMTGYQEILTDPSYKGQIVTMTYPLIGNYGVNPNDFESKGPWVEGFAVKEYCDYPSNWRNRERLGDFLKRYHIIGIEGIDTRALTKRTRTVGAMKGVLSTVDLDPQSLVRKAKASPGLIGRDLVREVTCAEPYRWDEGLFDCLQNRPHRVERRPFRVAAYDFGIKQNILRQLRDLGCRVTVVPATTPAREALAMKPDGFFLSNGPGDPAAVTYGIEAVRELVAARRPLLGICLGHQILGLAIGARTFKLPFGHHGGNHPVADLATGKVEITSQNHGFAVDRESLGDRGDCSHINLYDGTVEGIRLRERPVFSVQYHPEASPGPHDAGYLFRRFTDLMGT